MWVIKFVLFDQLDVRRKALRRTKRESSSNVGWNLHSSVSTPDSRTSRSASPRRLQTTEATGVSILQGERFISIFERSRGEEVVLAGIDAKEHLGR